ncbi:hypothetical protein niasHT_009126 [Heterodera trifolii]|uniref:Effector protein n=1 Tax=Heterodera trifolii TaxID=157864 RepID=A0ABD2M989_9BILA
MPNFLLISFFALVVLWPISLAIDTEDVKNFEDEFSLLTSSTWDIISKLRLVSQRAVTFVRVAGPVGALIAAGADVAFKKVTDPLDAIERFYFGIMDPSGKRSGYKEEFISSCKGFSSHRSPRGILIHFWLNQRGCWLKPIAEGNKWQRKPLLHFSELVRMDLMKAALIASHCVEISYDGEKGRIEEEYRQIELLISEIAAHMVDWICAKLIITWPIISSEYAKTAIGNSPIIESEAEYEKVALNIKHVLDQMGEEKYLHTVIVFPNWTDERQVASICSVHHCFKFTDINEINVFVVRYEDDQYERAVRTSECCHNDFGCYSDKNPLCPD